MLSMLRRRVRNLVVILILVRMLVVIDARYFSLRYDDRGSPLREARLHAVGAHNVLCGYSLCSICYYMLNSRNCVLPSTLQQRRGGAGVRPCLLHAGRVCMLSDILRTIGSHHNLDVRYCSDFLQKKHLLSTV